VREADLKRAAQFYYQLIKNSDALRAEPINPL